MNLSYYRPTLGRPLSMSAAGLSENVSTIVDEIAGLTLMEVADLTEVLRNKFNIAEMPAIAMMMPGIGFWGPSGSAAAAKGGSAVKAEEKVERTAFDLKLESFEVAAKIKVIKEVRGFTNLGLKGAKDLVERAPAVMKRGC